MIDRLRELDSAATPGPWSYFISSYDNGTMFITDDASGDEQTVRADWLSEADAALIAEARNALPKLLAIVEAARDVLENVSPDDDHEGAFLDYLVPFEEIEALRKALDNR
jgi:hypothetical protein